MDYRKFRHTVFVSSLPASMALYSTEIVPNQFLLSIVEFKLQLLIDPISLNSLYTVPSGKVRCKNYRCY